MNENKIPPVKTLLIFGFGLIVLLFILVGAISFIEIRSLGSLTTTIHKHPLQVSNAALNASLSIAKMHRSMKDVVLAENPSALALAMSQVAEEEKIVLNHLDIVKDLILGAEGERLEQETREMFRLWQPIREDVIGLVKKGERKKAALITQGRGATYVHKLEQQMLRLASYAHAKADEFMGQSLTVERQSSFFVAFAVIAGALLSILIAWWAARQILSSFDFRKKAEEKFKDFILSANDGFALYDSDLNLSEINNKALEVFPPGTTSETLRGKNMLNIDPDLQKTGRYDAYLAVKNTGVPLFFDNIVSNTAFGNRHLSIKAFKVGDGLGFIFSDITEKVQEKAERERLEKRLQQAHKMEAIGALAGGIAHDFNNILAVILGYTEIARDDCPAGSTMTQDLAVALEAGNRAKGLVQQILDFSRQSDTECISLRPATIVKEAVKMLNPLLPATIEIHQDIAAKTGLIFADPTQINQIMINLCTNAFHAMEETGGRLEIVLKETELITQDLVQEPEVAPGTFVQLTVSDSGTGIAPTIKNRVFEPYFTTKEVGKGTGMGLANVHGIVKSYGGFISLYSEPGTGSAFNIFFPVMGDEEQPVVVDNEQAPSGRERILFVDDDEKIAEMNLYMLKRLGYQVTMRNSSLEALTTFQNQPDQFDLVITDYTMPGMTGLDLARRMIQIRPDIPVILCTGYSALVTEEKAKAMGIREFALKPLAKKDLAKLIRKALDVG